MTLSKLPDISIRQLYRYLARYIRHSPLATRATVPKNRLRVPSDAGVGVFFFPADSWKKKTTFAVGPLGETSAVIHPSKFQIVRSVAGFEVTQPEILYWGTGGGVSQTKNAISGVSEGFAVTLELHGVGYRVEVDDKRNVVVFRLGFSHTIEMPLSDGNTFFNVINPQLIQVAGINREHVHQLASKVRALRPPEPYKGKGIRYKSEPVRRKETRKN